MTTYSIHEAAEKLGISVSVLRREITKKRLTGRKFGGRMYIIDSDLENYVKNSSTNPGYDNGVSERLVNREA